MCSALRTLCFQYLIYSCHALDISLARRELSTVPSPIVVPPSQYFEGNDGPWSSFFLRIGTPEQDVRTLISTASAETLVVLSQYGCTTKVFATVPVDCASSRGGMYNPNTSTTWEQQGFFGINDGTIGLEANLGYTQATQVGLDTLGLGLVAGVNGPTLEKMIVSGIASALPFYLGSLGLSPQPLNLSSLGNSTPSYFQSLKSENLIPSLSWSYTAGAPYRLKKVFGQLIFGGYDTSRLVSNSVSFDLAGDISRDIVVALQSISFIGSTQSSLLETPFFAFIDSTDPNLWLPASACRAFESAFGLVLDKTSGLYLLNSSQHSRLQTENPTVSFRLSDSLTGGQIVSITLPYSAFDLTLSVPFVDNETAYFPLREAANETQYTLGRTFLQEAYLTVDYERGNFSISQCAWVAGASTTIETIFSKDYVPLSSSSGSSSPSASSGAVGVGEGKGRIGTGAIAGLVIGIMLPCLGVAAFWFLRRRRLQHNGMETLPDIANNQNWPDSYSISFLTKTHSELSNDAQVYQLHSEQKAFEGSEMDAHLQPVFVPGRKLGGYGTSVHEDGAGQVDRAELDAVNTARVPRLMVGP